MSERPEDRQTGTGGAGDPPVADDQADASVDASVDASADASVDASADASVDASADASADAPIDASADASADAPIDAGVAALLDAARAVQANAHVPYSNFRVGAAIRTPSGRVFVGCNVENAAYPEGLCAEAAAIAAMVSGGEREIDVVVTLCDGDALSTPCGGCRQKIREFATAATTVHAAGPDGVRTTYTVADLLPDSFGPENLLD
ncbi:MAG: cytidine deaminase [Ilumatobacter sp.]|uniref:cytidine deaminase n=1 Tax=Ilumatobacter sp. TaxID=1967498 RepID=UPI00261029F8|nr:cytidine deaminase [Ilumatobacter sp.]MDJ0769515.1 cytidine deaminase [Ilumatobacter sp.]